VLTGLDKGPASKLLGRWVKQIEADHTALHAILRRAEIEQPDNPAAWITGAIQVRARETAPLFAATVTPIDPYGLRAWIARQPDVVTEYSSHTGRDEPTINGYLIGMSAELLAEAARLPESWRGTWEALGTWMREDIAMIDPVLAAVRDQAARMGGGIGSLSLSPQHSQRASSPRLAAISSPRSGRSSGRSPLATRNKQSWHAVSLVTSIIGAVLSLRCGESWARAHRHAFS
jgi:hypothetical protein